MSFLPFSHCKVNMMTAATTWDCCYTNNRGQTGKARGSIPGTWSHNKYSLMTLPNPEADEGDTSSEKLNVFPGNKPNQGSAYSNTQIYLCVYVGKRWGYSKGMVGRYMSEQRKPQDLGREQSTNREKSVLQKQRTGFASTEKSRVLFQGLGQNQLNAFPSCDKDTVDVLM